MQTVVKSSDEDLEDAMAMDLPNDEDKGAMVVNSPNNKDTMVVVDIMIRLKDLVFFLNGEHWIIFLYPFAAVYDGNANYHQYIAALYGNYHHYEYSDYKFQVNIKWLVITY